MSKSFYHTGFYKAYLVIQMAIVTVAIGFNIISIIILDDANVVLNIDFILDNLNEVIGTIGININSFVTLIVIVNAMAIAAFYKVWKIMITEKKDHYTNVRYTKKYREAMENTISVDDTEPCQAPSKKDDKKAFYGSAGLNKTYNIHKDLGDSY